MKKTIITSFSLAAFAGAGVAQGQTFLDFSTLLDGSGQIFGVPSGGTQTQTFDISAAVGSTASLTVVYNENGYDWRNPGTNGTAGARGTNQPVAANATFTFTGVGCFGFQNNALLTQDNIGYINSSSVGTYTVLSTGSDGIAPTVTGLGTTSVNLNGTQGFFSGGTFDTHDMNYTGSGNVTLTYENALPNGSAENWNIYVTAPVPEPSSALLLGLGSLGLLARRKR
jgi:hypothetical protein